MYCHLAASTGEAGAVLRVSNRLRRRCAELFSSMQQLPRSCCTWPSIHRSWARVWRTFVTSPKLRCIVIFRSLDSVLQPQADTCAKIRGAHSQVRGMFISGHRQWCDTARPNSEAAAILSRLSQLPVVVLLQASRCTWTYLPPWAPRWTWTTSVLAGSSTATRSSFSARGQRRNVFVNRHFPAGSPSGMKSSRSCVRQFVGGCKVFV